jgi:uncharacterized protein YcfJ
VTGAVVGNQVGRGNGNTAMTILGAAAPWPLEIERT